MTTTIDHVVGLPAEGEAAPYYFLYIGRITSDDILGVLERQVDETLAYAKTISEERSLHAYAPGKWSIRQVLNHVSDTERVFSYRALWFARAFDSELPSFDQTLAATHALANDRPWASHVAEFGAVRQSTLALFRNMPRDAWLRRGTASGNPFTVRALAYVAAGHLAHHLAILKERY
jgi:hypothetical protein